MAQNQNMEQINGIQSTTDLNLPMQKYQYQKSDNIKVDNLRQDAFEKMPNGNSLFDCISIEKEDFTGTVRLEFEDILSLFDVIVPINFESLTNGIGSNIDGVRVYHNPESLYYEAVMNCINKNKAQQRKLKKDN